MPEVNFNLLAPSAELYSAPEVKMDPVAAYEKAKATRQSNMLAQLYAKHYDPQTGGVNYNALIPEAAQSGLDVTAIMPDVQKQQLSQAQIQHYKDLSAQEAESAEKTKRERLNAEMVQHAKESYMRLQGVNTPDQFWAWHLSNPELSGVDKESLSADILQQISTPEGFQQALANSKKALEGITGIKADEGIWKDAGDRLVQIDPVSGKEINSIKKGATPGQVLTNERLKESGVNTSSYPLLAQGIAEGRVSPDRVNSRNAPILEQALRLDPNADLNQLAGQGALARNPAFQQKAMAVESIPEVISKVAEAGKKLNFSDNLKAVADIQKWYAGQIQDPKLTEYMTLRNDSLMSIAYAMRQAGMSDYATRMEAEAASPSMSPKQLDAWVSAQMKALEPRLKQYRSVSVTGSKTSTPPAAGGGAKTTPQVGEVRKGYKFKGGNPSDANNWEKVK